MIPSRKTKNLQISKFNLVELHMPTSRLEKDATEEKKKEKLSSSLRKTTCRRIRLAGRLNSFPLSAIRDKWLYSSIVYITPDVSARSPKDRHGLCRVFYRGP